MEPHMAIGERFDGVLGAAQLGADWAFEILYRELNPRLMRYFAARVPTSAGEDLAAETWMSVARQLPAFEGGEKAFRGWVFTIAHGRLVQHWRDVRRRPASPYDPATIPDRPSDRDVEGDVVASMTAQQATRALVDLLSPDQSEVVLLRILADLDVDQVASVLGKRPGAVRVLQHKALKKLAGQNFSLEEVTR
jgi:RNA polymerase sigma factor (sigma-70 family)